MSKSYLNSTLKQLRYYKTLGEKTFDQLTDQELHKELSKDSNSIAIIVKHLVGNMLSRFTNFLTEDGEKKWRERDDEFMDSYSNREDMLIAWEKGWSCMFDAIEPLTENQLEDLVYIRNEGHTVIEALNRQICHYAYHVGQIVLIGKSLKGKNWISLSIPKGKTAEFNASKFKLQKAKRHFTDNL